MREGRILGLSPAGFHAVAYTEWGRADDPRVLICCHGLTRNGRDFDLLAQALAAERRVVCPDIAGRGKSDWLADPAHYAYPQYAADMAALIARLGVDEVDWLGTSMGGLIGMTLAAQPKSPIRRLIVNDIGPFLPQAALQRIAAYVGQDESFVSLAELEAHLRQRHAPFGPLSDAQWRHMAERSSRRKADGSLGLAYDPAIAVNVRAGVKDWSLWEIWERISCPVLALRGAESDLLLAGTAAEMARSGPRAELATFSGIGHAPALMSADQIAVVREWLNRA